MSRSGSYSSGSRTPSYSRGSSARYPPGTPDFDRYSRSSYSRSGAESPDFDQYSASSSVSNGRYTASESIRSTYSRRSSRYGNESPLHSSVRGDERSESGSLRQSRRLSENNGPLTGKSVRGNERSESGSLRQSRRLSENNGPLTGKSVSFDPDQVSPASEDEDYEAISPRSEEASVSRRESAASNVASTLGRASSSVMEKVEQVRDFWKMFYIKWGTPTLLVLILIPALYYGRETVSDMMDLVRGAGRQMSSKLDDIKYDAEIQAGIPQPFNLTAHLEPIWEQYSDILDNKDYEMWFLNARDAEDAILAMWNALPTSNNKTVDEIQQDIKMKGFIDYHMALRKRSEVNLENFLLSRSRVFGEMLQLTNSWGRYVHNTLNLNSSNAVILEPKEKERFAAYGFTEHNTTQHYRIENKTAYVLDHAAERLLTNMIKLHDGLVITREAHWPMEKANADWSDTTTNNSSAEEVDEWMLKSFALHDIKHARELEAKFIDSLVKQSPYAELWDNGRSHSTSLQKLEENLSSLQLHLYELRQKIVTALGQLSIESVIKIPDQEPRVVPLHFWAQNVDEILATCGTILQKPSQSLTRAEIHYGTLKANMAQFSGRQQLIRWRRESCGDTTCFDLAPDGAWGRFVGAAQRGWSLMSPGQPSKPFARRPPKMVKLERHDGEKTEASRAGQYEKVCCGWSGENLWLDYLRFGAKELVYLDPYRIDPPREKLVETEQDTES